MSWTSIKIKSNSTAYNWYTWDGWFDGYLDAGTYQLSVTEWTALAQGHETLELALAVSEGQMGTQTIILAETGIPIPEFAGAFPIVVTVLAFALFEIQSQRTGHKHRPKG